MKTILTARFFLVIFLGQILLGCVQKELRNAPDDLMSKISARFIQNDYVSAANTDFVNPYEEIGEKAERMHQELLLNPFAVPNRHAFERTLGIENPDKIAMVKAIAKELLSKEHVIFSEIQFDQMNKRLNNYELTSESVSKFFEDAEQNHALTPLQHKIIMVELQEIMTAKTNVKIKDICATIEYEVAHSMIDAMEKDKILIVNTVIRNLYTNSQIPIIGLSPIVISNDNHFQKAGGYVIAGLLVVFAVASIVNMFTSPDCDNSCKNTMIASAALFAMGGLIVCCCTDPGCSGAPQQ